MINDLTCSVLILTWHCFSVTSKVANNCCFSYVELQNALSATSCTCTFNVLHQANLYTQYVVPPHIRTYCIRATLCEIRMWRMLSMRFLASCEPTDTWSLPSPFSETVLFDKPPQTDSQWEWPEPYPPWDCQPHTSCGTRPQQEW